MKGQIINAKGEQAKVIAEVAVSLEGRTRPMVIRACQLVESGIFFIDRNGFLQMTLSDKQDTMKHFAMLVMGESFGIDI